MVAIRDSLSNLASSVCEEDKEYEDDEDTELGKLSEVDEPTWVFGTISNTVRQRMERVQQKQMRLEELAEPWWGDADYYFCERHWMYSTIQLRVPAVDKLKTEDVVAAPALTVGGEVMDVELIGSTDITMPRTMM